MYGQAHILHLLKDDQIWKGQLPQASSAFHLLKWIIHDHWTKVPLSTYWASSNKMDQWMFKVFSSRHLITEYSLTFGDVEVNQWDLRHSVTGQQWRCYWQIVPPIDSGIAINQWDAIGVTMVNSNTQWLNTNVITIKHGITVGYCYNDVMHTVGYTPILTCVSQGDALLCCVTPTVSTKAPCQGYLTKSIWPNGIQHHLGTVCAKIG